MVKGERTPCEGDTLIVDDSRRYAITRIDPAVVGWWFEARATDGSSRLMGNELLRWDEAANSWRPDDDVPDTHSPPRRARLRKRRVREGAEGGNRT